MDRDKIQEKLKKIKALAERGVGGEKESAIRLYNELLSKYEINEEEIFEEQLLKRWFRYSDDLDKKLLAQIFYKVTGDGQYYEKTDKRKRMIGIECTDFELNEILFYYRFYSEHMKNELDTFIRAFFNMNSLFPDSSARCYEKFRAEHDLDSELSIEDLERLEKMFAMQKGMSRKTPTIQIEDKNKLEGQSCES
ncbi:MAG: hypothetical protein J6A59_01425 [Lachnospiraceae bacterium]|nr:hypothetical protein [Lachnospiraceae bacterium]